MGAAHNRLDRTDPYPAWGSWLPTGGQSDPSRRLIELVAFDAASGDDPGGPFGDVTVRRCRPDNVVDGGRLGCAAGE